MNAKKSFAYLGSVLAVAIFAFAAMPTESVRADGGVPFTGGGFDVMDSGVGTPSYYEPTSFSYYEPSSYSYYEPDYTSYYEPDTFSYYQPDYYSYYQPSYDYGYNDAYYGGGSYSNDCGYWCSGYYGTYPTYPDTPIYTSSYTYQPPVYDYSTYSYDYSSDYVYDYTYTYDYCSNIPGDQPSGYDCYPDHHSSRDVSCSLDASDTRVEDGDRITLSWDTSGDVTYASINEGIGRVDEDGGSERVRVTDDTTFRLTVRNNRGDEDTCSVTVRVDDRNDFSSVTFTGTPVNNPPVVYLSSLPYTGLEDMDPALLSFWVMLIAAALAGVWFAYRQGLIPRFAFASVADEPSVDEGHADVETGHVVTDEPASDALIAALSMGDTASAVEVLRDAAASGADIEQVLHTAVATAPAHLSARLKAAHTASLETGVRGAREALEA